MTRQASAIDELSLGLRRMTADTPPLLRRGVSGLGPARFSFDAVSHLSASSSHLMLSPAAAASPPGPVRKRFDQFLGRFFSSNPADGMTTAVARPAELGDEDDDPVVRQRFTDALAEHLASVAPREPKARAIHWARAYTQAQYQQTAALWAVLSGTPKYVVALGNASRRGSIAHAWRTPIGGRAAPARALGMDKLLEHFRQGKAPDPAWSVQLQLLENLYSALEELHFPAPAGFHTALAVWAFHCLPRQYVTLPSRGKATCAVTPGGSQLLAAVGPSDLVSSVSCCSTSTARYCASPRRPRSTSWCARWAPATTGPTATSRRACSRTSEARCGRQLAPAPSAMGGRSNAMPFSCLRGAARAADDCAAVHADAAGAQSISASHGGHGRGGGACLGAKSSLTGACALALWACGAVYDSRGARPGQIFRRA